MIINVSIFRYRGKICSQYKSIFTIIRMGISPKKTDEMNLIRHKILDYCKDTPRSLTEISNFLEMNRHTLRTGYLYQMVKENLLYSTLRNESKQSTRYKKI